MAHRKGLGSFVGLTAITLALAVSPADSAPAKQSSASNATATAAFASANHLTGLSPASLSSVRLGCRGLSPASAQDCPASAFHVAGS